MQQAQTNLALAATNRYGTEAAHEGAQELNLALAAEIQAGMAEKAATHRALDYRSGAFEALGVPQPPKDSKETRMDLLSKDPVKLRLYNEHMGNLPALKNAWKNHSWWETHGTPENVSGFLDYAKSKGAQFTPESEALFRAQAGARDPGIRSQFGPYMEEYVKNKPQELNFYQ